MPRCPGFRLYLLPDSVCQGDLVLQLDLVARDIAAPANGDLWYGCTLAKFHGRQAGSTVDLVGAGGGDVAEGDKATSLGRVAVPSGVLATKLQKTIQRAAGRGGIREYKIDIHQIAKPLCIDMRCRGDADNAVRND